MYRLFLTLIILLVDQSIYSQNNYKIKYWKANNAYAELKEYYQKEYEKDTLNIEILKELAFYEYNIKEYENCIFHYDKLIKNKKNVDPDFYLFNGKANKILENYTKAKELFKEGLKQSKQINDKKYINFFNRELESIDWAIKNNLNKIEYHETLINKFQKNYSIYNSNWIDNQILLTNFNLENDSISTVVYNPITNKSKILNHNFNNKKIGNFTRFYKNKYFFSVCDSINNCKIVLGEIINDSIINIKEIKGLNCNSKISYTMPFFMESNNKNYLLYCSTNNSKGGLDIYIGELIYEDSIINETNLYAINTPNDDLSPFFDQKNNLLYFSNSWMNGFGGIDIFKTEFTNLKTSSIENLGKPFNSGYNDLFFNIKDSIYTLTSNRKDNQYCCNNYFHFTKKIEIDKKINNDSILFDEIKKLTDIKNLDSINHDLNTHLFPIRLYFHNDIPNPKSLDTSTIIDYGYTYYNYLLLDKEYLEQNKKNNSKLDIEKFFIEEIPKGFNDLNKLLEIISKDIKTNQNRKYRILIKGFASPLASNSYNLKLSKRRNSSIINYIKKYKFGIFSDKIGKKIFFEYTPFGEENADKNVNDNPKIKNKSIYSIEAAKERKIELIGIEISE